MTTWPAIDRAVVARRVLTFDRGHRSELPRGVLIGDGRIVGFFDPDDRASRRSLGALPEDAASEVLVPGFIDAHNHLPSAVFDHFSVRTAHVESTSQLIDVLRVAADEVEPGQWILTEHALSGQQLDGGQPPAAAQLDAASASHPIAVRLGAHVMALNTEALQLSGIDVLAHDPPGGIVERTPDGRPTGVIREYGVLQMVHRAAGTRPADLDLAQAIRATQATYAASGITTVRVTGFRPGEFAHFHRVLAEDGFLGTRVFGGPRVDPTDPLDTQLRSWETWAAPTGFGDSWLGHDAVKIFVDHGVETIAGGGQTELLMDPAELELLVRAATTSGWAVTCHAATRQAAVMVIEVFSRVRASSSVRLTIEHGFDLSDVELKAMAEFDIWWSTQPAVVGIELGPDAAGMQRMRLMPLRSALHLGVKCALGSDWNAMPGTRRRPFSPLRSVALVVERRSLWGEDFDGTESVPAATALQLHTRAPAELLGRDDLGGLWPGARADVVALSDDPTLDLDASVELTVVGGRTVFER